MNGRDEVIVAGGGAAGLASASMLQRRGIPALVLERTEQVAASWRGRYDSLILNTPRFTSTLAGYRMPRRYGRWPSRDDVVEYLEEYARRLHIRIRPDYRLQAGQRRVPLVLGSRTHPNAPGLYFNGYLGTISGALRHMRRQARAIARVIARGSS